MTLQNAIALITHPDISRQARANWIDLGCGSGLFTYALANLLQKGSTITAIDKTTRPLQALPNPQNILVQTKQMDFTKDPLTFAGLTGILMANSLHYVADKMHFIAAAEKQLAADGNFLIVEYNTDKPNPWVPYPSSLPSLELLFAKAGYRTFIKLKEMPSLYNSAGMYAALIKK